jgi:hypothetical protein
VEYAKHQVEFEKSIEDIGVMEMAASEYNSEIYYPNKARGIKGGQVDRKEAQDSLFWSSGKDGARDRPLDHLRFVLQEPQHHPLRREEKDEDGAPG